MLRFSLFGIPVTVQPWHWLILAFVGNGLYIRDRDSLILTLLAMAAGFASILIHELGHALTGLRFGARRPEIIMHGFGGVALFPGAHFSRSQHIWVTLMGPAVQLGCGLIVLGLALKGIIPATHLGTLAWWFIVFSLFWSILNLFPVYPLDGGQILLQALGPRRQVLTLRISMCTAIGLAIAMFFLTRSILFPILLGFMAWENYKMLTRRPY